MYRLSLPTNKRADGYQNPQDEQQYNVLLARAENATQRTTAAAEDGTAA